MTISVVAFKYQLDVPYYELFTYQYSPFLNFNPADYSRLITNGTYTDHAIQRINGSAVEANKVQGKIDNYSVNFLMSWLCEFLFVQYLKT